VNAETTEHWLDLLEPAGIWCARVLRYDELRQEPGYQALEVEQTVTRDGDFPVRTLRSPIRIGGQRQFNLEAAPRVGQNNERILAEILDV
jgi:CoA:oxalate CoA-transferase